MWGFPTYTIGSESSTGDFNDAHDEYVGNSELNRYNRDSEDNEDNDYSEGLRCISI